MISASLEKNIILDEKKTKRIRILYATKRGIRGFSKFF